MLQWPWLRFEKFYDAAQLRALIERIEHRRDAMIAAFWSNDGFNDDKGSRRQAIEELEGNAEEAIRFVIYGPEEEEEIDPENPFFAPAMKGVDSIKRPRNDEGRVDDVIRDEQYEHLEIDQ